MFPSNFTVKDHKIKGGSFVHTVIQDFNIAFIMPNEREDMLVLSVGMDNMLDGMQHTAALFDIIYSVVNGNKYMLEFVEAIRLSTIEIEPGVKLMVSKKLPHIRQNATW
ncbi:phosphate transport regulator [Planococcus antarcticus DSM 14505]|uniref:Phosphate transport regulator n=1 Tax=Planococcus antarcticus DSM 14505 TaxID=1185653 RepID=A0A1C7DJW4_9BACL|nr:hypothetical protein [Planococcus antarcticus]ANU11678.1 hypothetical protein BBH88_16070 [Planococcus antarcticus DSM 14505]EIM04923.1 phosphate transport regulator [Planococcus antarcticus DSM 14505]